MGKLVRDRIPEILTAAKVDFVAYPIAGVDLLIALRAKLDEEVAEYDAASGADAITDELADIIEVVYALGAYRGVASSTIDRFRARKAVERGGFNRGIWLEQ